MIKGFMAVTSLTAKQLKFCNRYITNGRRREEAYRFAYDCKDQSDATVAADSGGLIANPTISLFIEQQTALTSLAENFGVPETLKMFLEIAYADPRELIGLRIGCCRRCWGEGHKHQWKTFEYVEAIEAAQAIAGPLPDIAGGVGYDHTRDPSPDCPECRGEGVQRVVPRDTDKLSPAAARLYGGVKQTKDGLQIIIADQMKARDSVARIVGAYKDNAKIGGLIVGMASFAEMAGTLSQVDAARKYQEIIRGNMAVN